MTDDKRDPQGQAPTPGQSPRRGKRPAPTIDLKATEVASDATAAAPQDGKPDQPYVATIRKVGLDLGITEQSTLAWAVFAPVERSGIGDLSGNYAGAQGSATVGIGLGANVLVGGSANSIALQPLSVSGSTGISVAVGLAGLELRPGR